MRILTRYRALMSELFTEAEIHAAPSNIQISILRRQFQRDQRQNFLSRHLQWNLQGFRRFHCDSESLRIPR